MTKKEKQFATMKYQLLQKKQNRVKEVIWTLNQEQIEYIEQVLGFEVIPWIYEVTTKPISAIVRKNNSVLREVHYAYKKGKKKICMKPNKQMLSTLKNGQVFHKPIKYKIVFS